MELSVSDLLDQLRGDAVLPLMATVASWVLSPSSAKNTAKKVEPTKARSALEKGVGIAQLGSN